jgi:hypothetical protein
MVVGRVRLSGIAEHQLRRIAGDQVFFRKGEYRCQMRLGEDEHVRKTRVYRSTRPKPTRRRQ